MQCNNHLRNNDLISNTGNTNDQYSDPLFNYSNAGDPVNHERRSSYFNNATATNMDEKICAVIHKNNMLERYPD